MDNTAVIFLVLACLLFLGCLVFFLMFQKLSSKVKEAAVLKNNYENVIQQANDALLVIDIVNGKIYMANPKLAELLGYSHEKLLKLSVFDLHPKEMLNRCAESIADVWENKGSIYSDIPFIGSSGDIIPVECSGKVIPYDGRPAILISARDIRDRLRMEKDIRDKNAIIGQKNRDITDSINYARRIQHAILSDMHEIKEWLPESFILFKPKDIVSGDFYWFTRKEDVTFIAAADCTGHGVPGAFMSMVANSFLNEIVNEKGILQPNKVLDNLREKIISALKQKGETSETKDGLDISLVAIKNETLEFAAANNPLWVITNTEQGAKELNEIPPDKQPIGAHPYPKPFTLHTLQLKKGDSLYLFSDGYADQFGGPRRKKFMYRQFSELLLSIQDKNMKEQKKIIDATLEEWKGNLEQIDDILVIGIRI